MFWLGMLPTVLRPPSSGSTGWCNVLTKMFVLGLLLAHKDVARAEGIIRSKLCSEGAILTYLRDALREYQATTREGALLESGILKRLQRTEGRP